MIAAHNARDHLFAAHFKAEERRLESRLEQVHTNARSEARLADRGSRCNEHEIARLQAARERHGVHGEIACRCDVLLSLHLGDDRLLLTPRLLWEEVRDIFPLFREKGRDLFDASVADHRLCFFIEEHRLASRSLCLHDDDRRLCREGHRREEFGEEGDAADFFQFATPAHLIAEKKEVTGIEFFDHPLPRVENIAITRIIEIVGREDRGELAVAVVDHPDEGIAFRLDRMHRRILGAIGEGLEHYLLAVKNA